MKTFDGYKKRALTDSNLLLASGGNKPLSDFIGTLNWDSTNRKLQYKKIGDTNWNDLVTFGSNALNSIAYLPLSGGTISNESFGQFIIERKNNDNYAAVGFKNSTGVLGYIGMTTKDGNLIHLNSNTSGLYTIYDSNNLDISNFLLLSGTGSPINNNDPKYVMTGTIWFKDCDGIKIRSNNLDLKIWEVTGNSLSYASLYGFYELYRGTEGDNNNTLELYADNLVGSHVKVRTIYLDGTVTFHPTITFSNKVNASISGTADYLNILHSTSSRLNGNSNTFFVDYVEDHDLRPGDPFYAFGMMHLRIGQGYYGQIAMNYLGGIAYRTASSLVSTIPWITVLDTANSSVSGKTITINGTSTTWENTWRGITDIYNPTTADSNISLSLTGAKSLYNALLNGYASSAGISDWLTKHKLTTSDNLNLLNNDGYYYSANNDRPTNQKGYNSAILLVSGRLLSERHQLEFSSNTGRIYYRTNNLSTTWTSWDTIAFLSDLPSKSSWNYDDVYLKLSGGNITSNSSLPLSIGGGNDGYLHNILLLPSKNWSGILFCGNDKTSAGIGTSAKSYWVGNNDGKFSITLNGSGNTTKSLYCDGTDWYVNTKKLYHEGNKPTKSDVGLGNVENTALSTWAGSANLTTCNLGTFGTMAHASISDYVPMSGLSTSSYMTGGIYMYNTSGLYINSPNTDLDIWHIVGNSGSWASLYGFNLKYCGTRGGNDNDLVLYSHNLSGEHQEVYRIHLDGQIILNKVVTCKDVYSYIKSSGNGNVYYIPRYNDLHTYLNYGEKGWNIRNSSSTNIAFFSSGGNLGLGTIDPNYLLDVRGYIGALYGFELFGDSERTYRLTIAPTTGELFRIYSIKANGTTYKDLVIGNSSDGIYFLASTGNVGIGTNSPSQKLAVNGNTNIAGALSVTNNITAKSDIVYTGNCTIYKLVDTKSRLINAWKTNYTNGAEMGYTPDYSAFYINKLAIGHDAPNYTLDVVGTTNIKGNLFVGQDVNTWQSYLRLLEFPSLASGYQGAYFSYDGVNDRLIMGTNDNNTASGDIIYATVARGGTVVDFKGTPTVNGTAVSLNGHTHTYTLDNIADGISRKLSNYLPKSGGTISNSGWAGQLTINRTNSGWGPSITFTMNGSNCGCIAMDTSNNLLVADVGGTWNNVVLTSGNWSSYISLPTKNSWNYDDRYLKLSGNSTSNPITGTIYINGVNGLHLNSNNVDMDIWAISGDNGDWGKTYGFTLRYIGTGSGNNNDLVLYAHNTTGSYVAAYRIHLNGETIFASNVTASNFYSSSDIRLKKDINNISKSIRAFKWKDSDKKAYGLIAQEIEKDYPELVSTKSDGYKTINYNSALCMIIAKLENELDELRDRINLLQTPPPLSNS